jgi:hypothetical protein
LKKSFFEGWSRMPGCKAPLPAGANGPPSIPNSPPFYFALLYWIVEELALLGWPEHTPDPGDLNP